MDLRQDWPTALQEAGFDASQPSVWSAEGLLRYLPAKAQDLLFERINSLSPAGSWLATNLPAKNAVDPDLLASQRDQSKRLRAAAADVLDAEIPDVEDLWYPEERTDVADWLARTRLGRVGDRHGRSADPIRARRPRGQRAAASRFRLCATFLIAADAIRCAATSSGRMRGKLAGRLSMFLYRSTNRTALGSSAVAQVFSVY